MLICNLSYGLSALKCFSHMYLIVAYSPRMR